MYLIFVLSFVRIYFQILFQAREIEKRFHEVILIQRDLLFAASVLRYGFDEDSSITGKYLNSSSLESDYKLCFNLGLSPSLLKFTPTRRSDIQEWSFIGKSGLNAPNTINPKQKIEAASKESLQDVIREVQFESFPIFICIDMISFSVDGDDQQPFQSSRASD
jgi:hypothetical protein